ncbi:Di-copper centre-containing protein [Mollisia scopiformis]|uniref:Di-copper centre-containing protein n=1 Tax=Mollisia scopiformis TaxID=149040 RepID=A0A194XJ83_MOLSC|nr:Di-copper centre-containing protein [Mollisia scopiformis]KUJ20310.1 Di-copper centre-containing protein [Mollisia scopiformis]
MFLRIVLAWTLYIVSYVVVAAPAPAPIDSSPSYKVSGVHTGSKRQAGQIWPARHNINDLVNNIPQWSLFVQAYNQWQQQPEDFFDSYYQIAGIHGRPYYSWNNAPQGPGSPTTGYCTHGSVLFLSWHRPYLALYEQEIAAIIQDIVQTYPASMQPTWQVAADQFRIPYWDWASSPNMPDVVSQPTVQITNSAGRNQTVTNPLYQYSFQNMPMNQTWFPTNAGDGWLANYPQTMRGVNTKGGPSNPALSNYYLNYFGLQKGIWYALTRNAGMYNNFTTTATQGSSIEAVHNNVHIGIGANYGHMSFLTYSAFDPIFWLHHANVDRLYALWQAMNPDSWITPTTEPYGTFALPPGTPDNENTSLEPFASSGSSPYYTPDTSRMPNIFGYTYPEIPDWSIPASQLTAEVTAQVHTLYNPSNQYRKRADTPGEVTKEVSIHRSKFPRILMIIVYQVQVNKFDLLGTPFSIHLFLGHVPENPQDWLSSPNQVGSTAIFPPPHVDGTPFPEVLAYSEFSLVEALNDKGQDQDDIGAVTEYLKQHLHWKVQKFDGTAVPTDKVPSLVVMVQNEDVTMAKDTTELPTYSNITVVPEITSGQAGGFSR